MGKYSNKQEFCTWDSLLSKIMELKRSNVYCVIKLLSNESLRKNKLKRHLETKHPQHVKKNRIFFQHWETELIQSRISSETNPALLASKQATLASSVVSLRIGREMKPHMIGERLIKPAAIGMPESQHGLETAVCLAIERHSEKSHCRPFIERNKPSGCLNAEGGKVELSTWWVNRP